MNNVKPLKNFQLRRQQLAFTAYIRDPEKNSALPGIDSERLEIYRELFFNNVRDTLGSSFPVIKQTLDKKLWENLCYRFYADHECRTPYLSELPFEFYEYLQTYSADQLPEWVAELALWEWTELELFLFPDSNVVAHEPVDLMRQIPVLNPAMRIYSFNYPVNRISPDFIPDSPLQAPIFLLAWRKKDETIGFMEVNALSASLIELLGQEHSSSGQDLVMQLSRMVPDIELSVLMQGAEVILNDFYQRGILLGSKPALAVD